MEINIQINNQTDFDFPLENFERIFTQTVRASGAKCLAAKTVELSVAFVTEAEIARINKEYRAKDKATDVLSFAEYASAAALCAETEKKVMLGELIICPAFIAQSAEAQGFSLENEFVYIVSHGILHLLGFDHGEEMFAVQAKVVEEYF